MSRTLTMPEAAKELRKSRRWLQDWLAKNPVDAAGIPFYSPLGRTKFFNDTDLERIRAAAREEERCRLSQSRPAKAKARTGRAGAAHLGRHVDRSTKALTKPLAKKIIRKWNARSNVVSLPNRASRRSRAPL
jgi:hypothetical protein